jgi:hypothetical protein
MTLGLAKNVCRNRLARGHAEWHVCLRSNLDLLRHNDIDNEVDWK